MKIAIITDGNKGLGLAQTRAILAKDPARRDKMEGGIPGGKSGTPKKSPIASTPLPATSRGMSPAWLCPSMANIPEDTEGRVTCTKFILNAARDVGVDQVEKPQDIAPDHVRLRMATTSICDTDKHHFRHFANAGFFLDYPVILRHEACTYVDDATGHNFAKCALVAINPVIKCRDCAACQRGDTNMCPTRRCPGSATTKPHIDGLSSA